MLHAVLDEPASAAPDGDVFDAALAGRSHRLLRADGVELPLATERWDDDADDNDRWILDRCAGPTLDLGCGPGRLVIALADRGLSALGVDVCARAVARCRERGAAVVHRDVFGPLPDEGRWGHVVLADGNIGIGGDPVTLLHRCRALIAVTGSVLVELAASPGFWCGDAQLLLESGQDGVTRPGPRFPWAVVGEDAVDEVAAQAGMVVVDRAAPSSGTRRFAELAVAHPRPTRSGSWGGCLATHR